MPRFVAALLLQALLFTTLGLAQKPPEVPSSDGRRWRDLRDDIKLAWLVGYNEGLSTAITASASKDTFSSQMDAFFPGKLSFGEVRTALDRFYETPENRPIAVGMAILVVVESAAGIPQSKIDDFVSSLRRHANDPPTK